MVSEWCKSLLGDVYEQTFITHDSVIIQHYYTGVIIYFSKLLTWW